MSSLLFHPQLRFVVLCYLPVEDLLLSYRPTNSQSMDCAWDHTTEVIIEYVNRGIDFSVVDFARQYWPVFCRLHRVESEVFRPTLDKMFNGIPEGTDRFQREKVALCWSNMGNLASVERFKCVDPTSGGSRAFNPVQCVTRALEIAPTLSRAWRNLSLELDSTLCGKATVAGKEYTALTAVVQAVLSDPTASTNWLALGTAVSRLDGPKTVEVWPGKAFTEVECYIHALELDDPMSAWDHYNKMRLWKNMGCILYSNWEDKSVEVLPKSFSVKGRPMYTVDCFVEAARCFEDPDALLLVASAMRGITNGEDHAACRNSKMPIVDKVEVLLEREWTALECVARALRQKSEETARAWRLAAEIQFVDKAVRKELFVVNGQSYDMMQCFVKAWLLDPPTAYNGRAYVVFWDRERYFSNFPLGSPVVVDGASYVIVSYDDGDDCALRWEKLDA